LLLTSQFLHVHCPLSATGWSGGHGVIDPRFWLGVQHDGEHAQMFVIAATCRFQEAGRRGEVGRSLLNG